MFWLAFGTAAAVIGLALMTIGVSRSSPHENLLTSPWFDGGLGGLVLGALLLLLALGLFLSRRREALSGGGATTPSKNTEAEAVRGYFAEREKLFKMWERDQRARRRKS